LVSTEILPERGEIAAQPFLAKLVLETAANGLAGYEEVRSHDEFNGDIDMKLGVILGLILMTFVSATVVADDPVMIRIYNDDADPIFVSVYDMNAQPQEATIGERINGFAWIPFSLAAGAAGKGDLQLIARTADPSFHKCGYEEVRGVENDATVSISANSSCGNPTRSSN
jgi:hypothetical protein